jgi:hypothetical protein
VLVPPVFKAAFDNTTVPVDYQVKLIRAVRLFLSDEERDAIKSISGVTLATI